MTQEKVFEKLAAIQAELHSPKSEYNSFGKYAYRTAEAILESVKPFLKAQGCTLTCTDELLLIGSRYYIKATATITAIEDGSSFSTCAYAREEEEKKGMDGSQVTGASSSYARKYALNGLLCIDNTPDSDATNVGDGTATTTKKTTATRQTGTAAPAPAAQPGEAAKLDEEDKVHLQWVDAIARHKKNKAGVDAEQIYREKFKPSEIEWKLLMDEVFKYQLQNGISN